MNLEQLEVFDLVAQLGSLSKAAKTNDTAQSLVSRKVAQLESEWGDRLFHRTGRGVVLSDFGRRIHPHVQLLLGQADRLREEVKDAAGVPTGTVHIGVLPSMSRQFVTSLYSHIKIGAPAVRLHITDGFSGQLDEQLVSGRLDMAVINRYGTSRIGGEEILGSVETFVVGPPGSSFLQGDTMHFRDLDGIPLVLPTAPNGLRTVLEQIARQKGIRLDIVLEVDTLSAMKDVALSGSAFTILPFLAVDQEIAEGKLRAVRLTSPGIPRTIALSVTKQRPLSRAGRFVLSQVRQLVPDLLNRAPAGS